MKSKFIDYIDKKKHWVYRNIYRRLSPSVFYIFPKLMASMWYAYNMGVLPNLRHPKNVNELWIAINLKARKNKRERELRIRCADKFAVRQYVTEKGYANILNEIYGIYNSFDEINFDLLPDQFVLKLTSCSGMNFICRDKKELKLDKLRKIVNNWFKESKDFGLSTAEWHYVEIRPRLIVEKYLSMLGESLSLVDYKFHCFNGKIYHVETISDRNITTGTTNCDAYTIDWELKECVLPQYHIDRRVISKPLQFDLMKQIAEDLSADFEYVRVDLYEVEGEVLFGELTFTPVGCIEYDYYYYELENMCRFYYDTKK